MGLDFAGASKIIFSQNDVHFAKNRTLGIDRAIKCLRRAMTVVRAGTRDFAGASKIIF